MRRLFSKVRGWFQKASNDLQGSLTIVGGAVAVTMAVGFISLLIMALTVAVLVPRLFGIDPTKEPKSRPIVI